MPDKFLEIHYGDTDVDTSSNRGRPPASLELIESKPQKRAYIDLNTPTNRESVYEIYVQPQRAKAEDSDGNNVTVDMLRISLVAKVACTVYDGADDSAPVDYHTVATIQHAITVPRVDGADALIESLFRYDLGNIVGVVDVVADTYQEPFDSWMKGVPVLHGVIT
jgi:hypothetical protein